MPTWFRFFLYGISNTVGDIEKPGFGRWAVSGVDYNEYKIKHINETVFEGYPWKELNETDPDFDMEIEGIPHPEAPFSSHVMVGLGLLINYGQIVVMVIVLLNLLIAIISAEHEEAMDQQT